MKLIIGAENRRIAGYVLHDVQPLPGIDIVCEFFDLPKHVKRGSCEEIQMTHVLEHFPMKKVPEVLKVLKGMLKKGGKLYIEVPNFYWHALEILSDSTNRQVVEYAFGGQRNEWDYHYNGFTPLILHEDLVKAGFEVEQLLPNSSIECWAVKP
jgi:predicted SAM-dependent methyltransferase